MKDEMQGFHMNQISAIFFGEKTLYSALSQSESAAPRKPYVILSSWGPQQLTRILQMSDIIIREPSILLFLSTEALGAERDQASFGHW